MKLIGFTFGLVVAVSVGAGLALATSIALLATDRLPLLGFRHRRKPA